MRTLTARLASGEYEFHLSTFQIIYYRFEQAVCHLLFRRRPPDLEGVRLLNLGCGPHCFPGWINADDYAPKRRMRESKFRPNWSLDIARPWRCIDDYWDGIFSEHVLEHLSYSEAINALKECLRTLKPGGRIRISVPDLRAYVNLYVGDESDEQFPSFPHPALALSFLTQMHLHRSVWDAELLSMVLIELGFHQVHRATFRVGKDERLLKDDPEKAHDSVYVEAEKPDAMSLGV